MPVEITQPYLYLNLSHLSVPTGDIKVMKASQNRASRKLSKIDQFATENLNKKYKMAEFNLKTFS